jgi:hypothetical protein
MTDLIDEWFEGEDGGSNQLHDWTRDDVVRAMVKLGLTDTDSLIAMLAFLQSTDRLAEKYDLDFADASQRAMIVALDRNRASPHPWQTRLAFWWQRVRTVRKLSSD